MSKGAGAPRGQGTGGTRVTVTLQRSWTVQGWLHCFVIAGPLGGAGAAQVHLLLKGLSGGLGLSMQHFLPP